MNYRLLGWVAAILVVIITAPYWLRKLNGWTVKTRDKRFLTLLKYLRIIHKPLSIVLLLVAGIHGYMMLGRIRMHTGLLALIGFTLTTLMGLAYWKSRDRRALHGHRVLVVASIILVVIHYFWPSLLWQLFGV